jgi:hypothetical protein
MNATLEQEERWSRARWGTMIALALGMQVGLFAFFGVGWPEPPRRAALRPAIGLVLDPAVNWSLRFGEAGRDPTVFALVNHRDFSGAAWLNVREREHSLPTWSEPPQWLEPAPNELGRAFLQFAQTNSDYTLQFSEKPAPHTRVPLPEPRAISDRSRVRVEGPLAARQPVTLPPLPSLAVTELPADSVVEVLANREGEVISARLARATPARQSDQQQADQRALELARQARFAPLKVAAGERMPDGLQAVAAGRLVFQWHSVEPPESEPEPAAQPR